MKTLIFSLALFMLGQAAASDRIVAVVGDDIITEQELDQRFQLTLRQVGQVPPNQLRLLYRQILNQLIDEQIQSQFAAEMGIRANTTQVSATLQTLLGGGALTPALAQLGPLAPAIQQQAEAQVRWRRVMQQFIVPRISISNAEIDRLIENLLGTETRTEWEVAQIFIPLREGAESQIQQELSAIRQQIEQDNSAFTSYARTFNGGEGDGYLGWFSSGELFPELEHHLKTMQIGELTPVIRTQAGFHIMALRNRRQQAAVVLEPQPQWRYLTFKGENRRELRQFARDLNRPSQALNELRQHDDATDSNWQFPSDINADIRRDIDNLGTGQWTIKSTADGAELYYMYGIRQYLPPETEQYRERVRQRLFSNRLELETRRFMRDLTRSVYLEVRL